MDIDSKISELNEYFGEIIYYEFLYTAWRKYNRHSPVLFSTDSGKYVYHYSESTKNIKQYKHKLDEKNNCKLISSPIIKIFDTGFVTSYVEGDLLSEESTFNIVQLANLHSLFNQSKDITLDYWSEKMNKIRSHLTKNSMIKEKQIPRFEFTQYGFLHGDFSPSNIVNSEKGLIVIDIEHILDGPLAFDLARPLLRICKNKDDKTAYLSEYMKGKTTLNEEELKFGFGIFYLNQAYYRNIWGYTAEAKISLSKFIRLFKEN